MTRTEKITRYIMMIGAVILGLIYLSPVYILLVNSLKTQKGIYLNAISFPSKLFFTTSNYPDAMERLGFLGAFTNSVVITVISTALIVILSSMTAWVLTRAKTKLANTIYYIFAIAMLIPFQCVMLPLVRIMNFMGLQNPPGIIFMYVGFGSSMSIILFAGFIKNIPLELEEAAYIDGCTMPYTFFIIVFPLLKTITVTVAVLNTMWIWNDFLLPQLMINKPAWQTLPLRTFLFFGQFSKRWDLATAALVLGMIPIIIFYMLAQKSIIKGVTDGAIK